MIKRNLPLLSAISSGFLFAISWPSAGFAPLIFIAFIPLLFYIESTPIPKLFDVFRVSLIAFLIWNASAAWWMCKFDLLGGALVILINASCMALILTLFALLKKRKIVPHTRADTVKTGVCEQKK